MKGMRRKIALLLAIAMLFSEGMMKSVLAEDLQPTHKEVESVEEKNETSEEQAGEIENNISDEILQEEEKAEQQEAEHQEDTNNDNEIPVDELIIEPQKEEVEMSETEETETEDAMEESVEVISEQRLNYIYVESPYLKTPGTQNIVVSWGDGTEGISDMTLLLQKEDGTQEEWKSVKNVGHLYLFSKKFSSNITTEYEVTKVKLTQAGVTREYNLQNINEVSTNFGVNKEYKGYSTNKQLLGEEERTSETGVELETNVVSFDANGKIQSENNIEDALEEAARDLPSLLEEKSQSKTVVVLDPGHDKKHPGASGNKLKEHVLTLKIAEYAKKKLETYDDVEVYMTRDTEECAFPGSTTSSCLEKRVEFAAEKKASLFISFHLNASASSSAEGAEVIHPNKNWKPQVGEEGEKLAQLIQKELIALGLKDRDIFSKNTKVDEYEDGSKQDWYGIPRYCKEKGFPGIIIEHAFISNKGDASNFLKTEAGLKKLGEADAIGIINYINSKKETVDLNGWKIQNGKWFYYENGKKVVGPKKINNDWYYFDEEGVMFDSGWRKDGEYTFYYNSNGTLVREVKKIDGAWYYFKGDGDMYKGWRTLGDQKFYYHEDGKLALGATKIDRSWYYFKGDGDMYKGWRTLEDQKFYYHEDGKLAKGVTKIDGSWYYFKSDGNMYKGWRTLGDQKFYYYEDGKLARGVAKIEGFWYYFESDGTMHTSWRTLGKQKFYYHEDGKLAIGILKLDGSWYYFKGDGTMYTGWRTSGKQKFYYHGNGKLAIGVTKIGNSWYYFKNNGEMLRNGWANGKYYGEDGVQRDRVYQNPSQYYQIKNSVSLSGGGYNLSYGYEGVKVMKVIQKLKLGNGIGMNGAFYSKRVESAVKKFQKNSGLKQTGVVDLATWLKMGYTKTQWEQWGAYVSPIKVDATSTRSEHIEAMISTAYSYLGTPYVIGASGPPGTGIDCSGLVMQGLYAAGMDISPINPVRHAKPGYEYESRNMWASKKFKHVPYSQRQRGDLIFYQSSSGVVIHVAIYLGDNKVIESWPNKVVVWPIKNNSRSNIKGVVRPFV